MVGFWLGGLGGVSDLFGVEFGENLGGLFTLWIWCALLVCGLWVEFVVLLALAFWRFAGIPVWCGVCIIY